MSAKTRIGLCRFGKGVFANTTIREGEEILRFSGPLVDLETVLAMGQRECNPLQVGPRLYMDIGEPGVLVNHSCEPNAGISEDSVLIAIREIHPGEEVFYDYSTTIAGDAWTLACQCGHRDCRGTVGEFQHLPEARRRRYLRLAVVQSYIARGCAELELR